MIRKKTIAGRYQPRLASARAVEWRSGSRESWSVHAVATCVARAGLVTMGFASLSIFDPLCAGPSWTAACDNAVRLVCRRMSRARGFGPVDTRGELFSFACVES
jgi:hypothetical protein